MVHAPRNGAPALQASNVQLGVLVRRGVGGTCPLRAAARQLHNHGLLSALLDEQPPKVPVGSAGQSATDVATVAEGCPLVVNGEPMEEGEELNEGGVVEGLDELVDNAAADDGTQAHTHGGQEQSQAGASPDRCGLTIAG